jgi:hypothetical protein
MRFLARLARRGRGQQRGNQRAGLIDSLATVLIIAERRNPQYDPSSILTTLVGVRDATLVGWFVARERPPLVRQLKSEAKTPDVEREMAQLADIFSALAAKGFWSPLFKESPSTVKPEYLGAYAFFESNCGRDEDELFSELKGERPQAAAGLTTARQ